MFFVMSLVGIYKEVSQSYHGHLFFLWRLRNARVQWRAEVLVLA